MKPGRIVVFLLTAATLFMTSASSINAHHPPDRTIKVAKHIVAGSGVTWEQMESWFNKAKEVWGANHLTLEQVTSDTVANVGDGKVADAINIYGVAGKTWGTADVPGANDQLDIQLPNSAKTHTESLAHEIGHWFNAKPDNQINDHGTWINGPPSGVDMNGDGTVTVADTSNIMYPGNMPAGALVRTGTSVDTSQHLRVSEAAKDWLDKVGAKAEGHGEDATDTVGDSGEAYNDINFGEAWATPYRLHLTLLLESVTTTVDSEIGYLIDADYNPSTGESLDGHGYDFRVTYNPALDVISLWHYDGGWITDSAAGTGRRLIYRQHDADEEPEFIGVELEVPWVSVALSGDSQLSLLGVAEEASSTDTIPNSGAFSFRTTELPPTGVNVTWRPLLALFAVVLGLVSLTRKRFLRPN